MQYLLFDLSIRFRVFASRISSYQQIFESKFDIREDCIVENHAVSFDYILKTFPMIDVKVSKWASFLSLVFHAKCNIFCLICLFMVQFSAE